MFKLRQSHVGQTALSCRGSVGYVAHPQAHDDSLWVKRWRVSAFVAGLT